MSPRKAFYYYFREHMSLGVSQAVQSLGLRQPSLGITTGHRLFSPPLNASVEKVNIFQE